MLSGVRSTRPYGAARQVCLSVGSCSLATALHQMLLVVLGPKPPLGRSCGGAYNVRAHGRECEFFVARSFRGVLNFHSTPVPPADLTSKDEMTATFQQLHPAFTLVAVAKAIG